MNSRHWRVESRHILWQGIRVENLASRRLMPGKRSSRRCCVRNKLTIMRQPDNRPGLTTNSTGKRDRRESVPSDRGPPARSNAGRVDTATVHASPSARVTIASSVALIVTVSKATLVWSHLARYEDERPVHRREDVSRTKIGNEDTDWLVSAERWTVVRQSNVLLDRELRSHYRALHSWQGHTSLTFSQWDSAVE